MDISDDNHSEDTSEGQTPNMSSNQLSVIRSVRSDPNPKETTESSEEKLCLVCLDMSSGKHYGAVTCEGCKGFFRRIVCFNNQNHYQCVNNDKPNQCPITNDNSRRKCCKSCRFQKCLAIGMKPELCVKVERPDDKSSVQSDMASTDLLFENEEQLQNAKREIIRSFELSFNTCVDPMFLPKDWITNNFYHRLNQMRVHLSAKVRTFVSNIDIFRRLDIKIQSQLVCDSMTELLILMFIIDFHRYQSFLTHNEHLFNDKELDTTFYTLLAMTNEFFAEFNERSNTKNRILVVIPALNLLVILNSHRFEAIGEPSEKYQISLAKERVLLAFDLTDQSKGSKISQILYFLRAINAMIIKRRIF